MQLKASHTAILINFFLNNNCRLDFDECGRYINMIFSVTYYLELRNAISYLMCISFFFPIKVELVVWTL